MTKPPTKEPTVADHTPSPAAGLSEADIERLRKADAEITAALKGPMSNLDRALLVADRKDIRAALQEAR